MEKSTAAVEQSQRGIFTTQDQRWDECSKQIIWGCFPQEEWRQHLKAHWGQQKKQSYLVANFEYQICLQSRIRIGSKQMDKSTKIGSMRTWDNKERTPKQLCTHDTKSDTQGLRTNNLK